MELPLGKPGGGFLFDLQRVVPVPSSVCGGGGGTLRSRYDGRSGASSGDGCASSRAIIRFISAISRTCASMMPSASLRTSGSLMWARSLVMIAIE